MTSPFVRTLTRALAGVRGAGTLSPPGGAGGWWPLIRESFTGAWQRNVVVDESLVLSFHAVFSCATLIASDISKLRLKYVELSNDNIWLEKANSAYSPVLRKPNPSQNRIQFWEGWVLSKLLRGNAYILKIRDRSNRVTQLWVLNPSLCKPLVADTGEVFYELGADNFSGLTQTIVVPAREIIHDRWNCLFHPLVGMSPIYANGLAATQGMKIQEHSAQFFENQANPGGVLVAPGRIDEADAMRVKTVWQERFRRENVGKIAVLGSNFRYERLGVNAGDAQMIEQLKWTAEVVCSTFHVPPYKIGIGEMPKYDNIQALNVEYYSQCLQRLIEDAEICLDEGLDMGIGVGTEFDVDGLLRMDSVTQMNVLKEGVGATVFSPNEARQRWGLPPTAGGEAPMTQQQNYSLAALAKRDAQADPFAKPGQAPATQPAVPAPNADAAKGTVDDDKRRASIERTRRRALDLAA